MPTFHVDLDDLDHTVALLRQASTSVQSELDTLDAHIAKLQDVWSGAAAEAQCAAHQEWTTGAVAMREALDAMRDAARLAHTNYSAVAANQKMWS